MQVAAARADFSSATPECGIRREYATASWLNDGQWQDQLYFRRIIAAQGWTEKNGAMVALREVLCRANSDPRGGLRSGKF